MQNYHSSNDSYGGLVQNDGSAYGVMDMGYNPYSNPDMAGIDAMGMDITDSSMMVPMDPYTGTPVAGGYYDDHNR